MIELVILLAVIGGLFLLTGWIDEKVNKKSFSKYTINIGITLFILALLTLAIIVERIINHLILKLC